MNPRLVILAGLPKTETVYLDLKEGESFTLGRGEECNLPLGNIAVSRKHCQIICGKKAFKIEDLHSHNGTFVNDLPIKSHLLSHGDRITLGNMCLIFLMKEEDDLPQMQVEFDDGSLAMNSTLRLFPQLNTANFSSDLNTLIKFGKALNEFSETEPLQKRFLEIIMEFIPAERGAILLVDEGLLESQSICFLEKNTSVNEPMQISRTVCQQVITEQVSLLSNDLANSNLKSSESLISKRISSVLCVPLTIGERKGLIYLDSSDNSFRFTENHLEQMTALSFLVGAALYNSESVENLRQENSLLKAGLEIETNMIGESRAIQEVFHLISKVAPTNSTVLITGESGTGKELVAKAIHQNSLRREKPFVAINCAVLSENLLESELFGYEKGAFTGATMQKKGKLESADGGTIFLDEIGELAPNLQAKLLRVLQEREFERVGGTKPVKVNVHVIAATNRNLAEEVKKGVFRDDLFFRLNVVQIKTPPLRQRKSDIPLLAQYFIKKYSEKCNRNVAGLSEKARKTLMNYEWQGNVRELENVIERAIVLGSTEFILPDDLPEEIVQSNIGSKANSSSDFHEQIKIAKQKIILESLEKSNGNYTEAGSRLGIHPNNLHRLIRSLGIKNETKGLG